MKVLVTGGAGFIGSNITERLLSEGHEVTVLDNLSTGKKENLEDFLGKPGFKFVEGSILDLNLLRNLFKERGIQKVSHQAARPSVARSVDDPLATHEANVTGTVNVLKVAHEAGCDRVVAASSSSVYGDTPVLPKREDMPLQPRSPYAASKASDELYFQAFYSVYGLQSVGLRYFNVYGRRQDPKSDYAAVIPKFIHLALAGKSLVIEGDGKQTRDFTYIDDVVNANLLALMTPKVQGEAVNIGFGEQTSILDLAKTIIASTGSSSEIQFTEPRLGDVRDSLASIERARSLFGYKPESPLSRGLAATIDWYR